MCTLSLHKDLILWRRQEKGYFLFLRNNYDHIEEYSLLHLKECFNPNIIQGDNFGTMVKTDLSSLIGLGQHSFS